MRRLLVLAAWLLLSVAGTAPAAAAMPSAVQAQLWRADDDPRAALADVEAEAARAQAAGDREGRFWWPLAQAFVLTRLERHAAAAASTEAAANALQAWPAAVEVHQLWLEMARLDAGAATGERPPLLARVTALRQRADALRQADLACDARSLEAWLLNDLRSDDEAWLAAEGLEQCGQALQHPEAVAFARLQMAMLVRAGLPEGKPDNKAMDTLAAAQQALGDRPARYLRSLIEWEAGILNRHLHQFDRARERLAQARRHSQDLGDDAGVAVANLELAAVLQRGGRPADSLPLLDEAQALLSRSSPDDLSYRMARILELRINGLAALGRPQVLAVVDQARAWAARDGAHLARAALWRAMAAGLASQGRHAAAYDTLLKAEQQEQASRARARDIQVLRLQARYDGVRRDAENAELKLRNDAARLALQAETDRRHALSAGLVALGALLLLALSFGGRELARRRRLADLALRDELTDMPNRRAVHAYAREQLAQARRLRLPLVLAMIDFDHFKRINDDHGHAVGDAVLQAFAQAAQTVLRGQDRLGRWGGEEWLLVMPGATLDEVDAVFERLRQRLADTVVPGLPAAARPTFSMGAAETGPDGADLDATVQQADRALYQAKARGRNRLVLASELTTEPASAGSAAA